MRKILYPGLVAEMAKRGDTQKTLSKLLNLTVSNISTRFVGKKDWSISEIEKICEFYNKNYDDLFKRGQ